MNVIRAILLGALAWLLIFVEWSIIIFTPFVKELSVTYQWAIHFIILIPIAYFCVWLYYKPSRKKDKTNGFLLGILYVLTGSILDIIITIPLFIEEGYLGYYSDYLLWIGFVEFVLIAGIYDMARKK